VSDKTYENMFSDVGIRYNYLAVELESMINVTTITCPIGVLLLGAAVRNL